MILTLTIQEDAAILSLFFKAAVYFTINIPIWTTLALSGQLPAVRMFDIHLRDGPRALGSKEIPQVGFKVQDLIINSPL